jgi:hypothetical protein
MANAPLPGRDDDGYSGDLGFGKTEIFFLRGLDKQEHEAKLICPTGKSVDGDVKTCSLAASELE